MKSPLWRSLLGAALAVPLAFTTIAPANAADVDLGSTVIQVPELAPIFVPVPLGSEAAPLPPLPYPMEWVRPAPPFDPFSGRTVALDCGNQPERLPGKIIIACGDGNGQFQNVRWTSWLDGTAEATADKVWIECVPACYNGTRRSKPARIVLHDVRQTSAGPTFARLTSHDDRGARTTTLPGFVFSGEWIFP